SSSDAGRAAKRGRWGPVHRETLPRPSSSPSSSPFQSHVACSFHLPIRLHTMWLPYALGDLARPPPRTARAPQLWHQRAPQRAPRPCPCVPTLKHGRPLGKSAVPIPPRVRGSGPCVARGASGSHTRVELRPGGLHEERGMRVRLRCRAAAGGESESARGSGNASANAHGTGDGDGESARHSALSEHLYMCVGEGSIGACPGCTCACAWDGTGDTSGDSGGVARTASACAA
ncbi:hypothetical protein DFH08DRAFT_891806, partial [Mycena albidolilacea]